MYTFNWNDEKNEILKKTRNISFEEIVEAILSNNLIEVKNHPNQDKYPDQYIYIINIDGYIYLVPFIKNEDEIFLKTIIPSRKETKKYKRGLYDR